MLAKNFAVLQEGIRAPGGFTYRTDPKERKKHGLLVQVQEGSEDDSVLNDPARLEALRRFGRIEVQ